MNNIVVAYLDDYTYMFEGTPTSIASFIWTHRDCKVTISDIWDLLILTATGGFLDKISDPDLREDILKELTPLQKGEKEPIEIEYTGIYP